LAQVVLGSQLPSSVLAMAAKMIAAVLLALTAGASAIELTPDTWDDATAGKSVFVKFLAPW